MKKIILTLALLLVITFGVQAQSHIADANYACRLKPKSLNTEKTLCPACEAKDKADKVAKAAEEKRRIAAAEARINAEREARQRAADLQKAEDKKNAHSGEVLINGNQTTNTTAKPLDNYNANTGLYTNPMANVSTGSSTLDNINKGYAQGQQIADVATGLIDLFTPSPEQQKRKEEERQRVREEAAKKKAVEKAMWDDYTKGKVLDKYIADAESGNETARVIVMFEIFRLSQIKDMTHLTPNLKSWIEEAVKNKNLDAMNFIGYHSIYNVKPFVNLTYTKEDGLKILEEAASLNSGDAMFTLGEYYNRKKMSKDLTTVSKVGGNDPEKAFAFFSKAAEQNHPDALYFLAEIYLNKYPAKKNDWFVTYTIEKNSSLGCTYMYNSLYPQEYQETLYQRFGIHLKRFLRHRVFKELSDRYANGTDCPKDPEMAKKLSDEIEKSSYEYSMKYYR